MVDNRCSGCLARISHEHHVDFQNISIFQEVRYSFNFSLNQHNDMDERYRLVG
jgi:hypothetical protein